MSDIYMVTLSEIKEESHLVKDEESGKIVRRPAHFLGMKTLIQGALSFVNYFEKMHQNRKVFVGNKPDGFRFHLKNGSMECICEDMFEEVSEFGEVLKEREGAIEINEYAAPELLDAYNNGEEYLHFNMETDHYFIAVFLFEYFFHTGSPFEGKMMVNRCFLSPLEKEMFRVDQGIFCMDITDMENRPVKGIQDKLIKYWDIYPEILQKSFMKSFYNGGISPEFRPSTVDWMQVFIKITMDYKECRCGFHGFTSGLKENENGTRICPNCGKTYYPLTNGMDTIWLSKGEKLYECQTGRAPFSKDVVTGIVVENKQKKGLFGIKNLSKGTWRGLFPDHTTKDIGQDQGIPIWNGMRIRFELGEDWFLRLNTFEFEEVENEA